MICQLPIIFFFCPFDILQYKFLSYREVLHVLSESSELSKLSELIELPEIFSSMEKALLCGALRLGDLLLELRFVSRSSETSRNSGTSQSSIRLHPVFPDVGERLRRRLLLNLLLRPLLIQWAQSDLASAHCLSITETTRRGSKQTNKGWHMWGHGCKGQYGVAPSVESTMQCVRVCGRASEMFGEAWSSVCKVIL